MALHVEYSSLIPTIIIRMSSTTNCCFDSIQFVSFRLFSFIVTNTFWSSKFPVFFFNIHLCKRVVSYRKSNCIEFSTEFGSVCFELIKLNHNEGSCSTYNYNVITPANLSQFKPTSLPLFHLQFLWFPIEFSCLLFEPTFTMFHTGSSK